MFKQPERLYEGQTIKLDRMTQRLFQAMTTIHHQKQRQAQGIIAQLQQQTPKGQLEKVSNNWHFTTKLANTNDTIVPKQTKAIHVRCSTIRLTQPTQNYGSRI